MKSPARTASEPATNGPGGAASPPPGDIDPIRRTVNTTKNAELHKHLTTIADLTDLDGGGSFRVFAFRRVSNAVRDAQFKVTAKNMGDLRGAGKSTKEVIAEFLATGTSQRFQDLCSRWPVEVLTMTAVHGIGAKTAFQIYQATGIRNLDELIAAAEKGGVVGRWESAIFLARDMQKGRVPLGIAKSIALLIKDALMETDGVRGVEICGSIRREKATCKDIDLVVKADPQNHARIHKAFSEMGLILVSGETKTTIVAEGYGHRMQCDCWTVVPEEWGAAVAYATGSKIHNMQLRALSRTKGMKLNEKGIWRRRDMKRLGGEHERDIYDVLGIPYVEPRDREDPYQRPSFSAG